MCGSGPPRRRREALRSSISRRPWCCTWLWTSTAGERRWRFERRGARAVQPERPRSGEARRRAEQCRAGHAGGVRGDVWVGLAGGAAAGDGPRRSPGAVDQVLSDAGVPPRRLRWGSQRIPSLVRRGVVLGDEGVVPRSESPRGTAHLWRGDQGSRSPWLGRAGNRPVSWQKASRDAWPTQSARFTAEAVA